MILLILGRLDLGRYIISNNNWNFIIVELESN